MKTIILKTLTLLILSSFIFSCDNNSDEKPAGKYDNGVFITNEGAFGAGNASVSFYSLSGDSISNNIFANTNNRPVGDVLQSAFNYNGNTYLVVNGSNKIEIVNSEDFKEKGVIESIENPRNLIEKSGKLYLSQWGENGVVKVIDPKTNEITVTIPVGTGPDAIIASLGNVIVANKGGYGEDSTITIIDPISNLVVKTIKTGTKPSAMAIDNDGNLWVLNSGTDIYDDSWNVIGYKPSSLVKISFSTLEIEDEFELFDEMHPTQLEISPDGNSLFIGGGFGFLGIYKISINAPEVPANPMISKSFYGFTVNKTTNEIYGFEAPTFTEAGNFYRYSINGNLINEYKVGIGPNGAAFF